MAVFCVDKNSELVTFTESKLGSVSHLLVHIGQDGRILGKFFLCVSMDQDEIKIHRHDRTSLVNKANTCADWFKTVFLLNN